MINTNRMFAYDFLKIMATILIMCHHYQQMFDVSFSHFINFYGGRIYWGYLVELFFLLSGWGIACKLDTNPIKNSASAHLGFLLGRYRRLWPIVLVASLYEFFLTRLYYEMYSEYLGWATLYSWYDVLLNLLGLAVGTFYHYFYVCIDSPLWYVNVLIVCYWIMIVELYMCRKCGWDKYKVFFITFLIGVACIFMGTHGFLPPNIPFLNPTMARGYMGFWGGILLYKYMNMHTLSSKQIRFISLVIVSGVLFIVFCDRIFSKISFIFLDCLFFPAVIMYFSRKEINDCFNRWYVEILVKSSFAMYALHVPFMESILFYERYSGTHIEKEGITIMLVYVVCMIFIGIMTWYIVEQKLLKICRINMMRKFFMI